MYTHVYDKRASHTPIPFVDDAKLNLCSVRDTYGSDSLRYHHLLRRYRGIADHLRCRLALERAVQALQQEPISCSASGS